MALVLVMYEDLFYLVRGYLHGAKVARRLGYSAATVHQCIGCALLCLSEAEPYICLPRKPSGPNLLDEPLKGFIVYPAYSPWKC